MTSETNSSLASLLNLVQTLKRDGDRPRLSSSEREARISAVIDRLSSVRPLPLSVQVAPMTLSADER